MKSLADKITEARKRFATCTVSYSLGEVVNLYRAREIILRPSFQRHFVWDLPRKTAFVESILIGMPIPPFFVALNDDRIMEVVDGQQRLSTVLEFMELLRDENDNILPPLVLGRGARHVNLRGLTWKGLDKPNQIDFKRSRVDLNQILSHSSRTAKTDLFMRLNTGGMPMSEEQVRECLANAT